MILIEDVCITLPGKRYGPYTPFSVPHGLLDSCDNVLEELGPPIGPHFPVDVVDIRVQWLSP